MENLLNLLLPPNCLFCNSLGEIFCNNCLSTCVLLTEQYCVDCGQPALKGFTHEKCLKPYIPTQLLCVFSYEGFVRECIKFSKYGEKQFMSLRKLTREGVQLLWEQDFSLQDLTCTPIPISRKKFDSRGFNQATLISKLLAWRYKLRNEEGLLFRVKETAAQHAIGREARFANLSQAFSAKKDRVLGRRILLVDDICTTGATFLEASRSLYEAGAKEVLCFALSKKL